MDKSVTQSHRETTTKDEGWVLVCLGVMPHIFSKTPQKNISGLNNADSEPTHPNPWVRVGGEITMGTVRTPCAKMAPVMSCVMYPPANPLRPVLDGAHQSKLLTITVSPGWHAPPKRMGMGVDMTQCHGSSFFQTRRKNTSVADDVRVMRPPNTRGAEHRDDDRRHPW